MNLNCAAATSDDDVRFNQGIQSGHGQRKFYPELCSCVRQQPTVARRLRTSLATGSNLRAAFHGSYYACLNKRQSQSAVDMRLHRLRKAGWSLIASAALYSGNIFAQTDPAQSSPQVWLNAGSFSYHFNRDKDFRENNTGFGAEVWLSEDHALMGGTFINSDQARSHYAAYQWRPLHWQVAAVRIGAGITLGAFDGYPRYRNGDWFPAALPVLSAEYKLVGVNLFLVPTIPDRLDGALSIQLKLRIW